MSNKCGHGAEKPPLHTDLLPRRTLLRFRWQWGRRTWEGDLCTPTISERGNTWGQGWVTLGSPRGRMGAFLFHKRKADGTTPALSSSREHFKISSSRNKADRERQKRGGGLIKWQKGDYSLCNLDVECFLLCILRIRVALILEEDLIECFLWEDERVQFVC